MTQHTSDANRSFLLLLMLVAVTSCAGASKHAGPPDSTKPGPASECGWREASKACKVDGDCPSDSTCVEGLGRIIKPDVPDGGVEVMPPYDRERVRYCQPRACPPAAPAPPAEAPAPAPAPEPAPTH